MNMFFGFQEEKIKPVQPEVNLLLSRMDYEVEEHITFSLNELKLHFNCQLISHHSPQTPMFVFINSAVPKDG